MNSLARNGLILGLVGALVDFVSGYFFLSQSMVVTNDMGMVVSNYNQYAVEWSAVLFAIGALLVITSLFGLSSIGMGKMKVLGGLMILYGIIMFFIGLVMYSGMTPMMDGSLYSSIAMFVVGVLMILNGALMSKHSRKVMPLMQSRRR